jgi:hypothetical protein
MVSYYLSEIRHSKGMLGRKLPSVSYRAAWTRFHPGSWPGLRRPWQFPSFFSFFRTGRWIAWMNLFPWTLPYLAWNSKDYGAMPHHDHATFLISPKSPIHMFSTIGYHTLPTERWVQYSSLLQSGQTHDLLIVSRMGWKWPCIISDHMS